MKEIPKFNEFINESVEIGDEFQHKHMPTMTCTILSYTNKGYKVKQKEGKKKEKTAFYDKQDFENSDKGLWEPKVN